MLVTLPLSLDPEIATPPLDGTILPGVTRMSLLELGATWVGRQIDRSRWFSGIVDIVVVLWFCLLLCGFTLNFVHIVQGTHKVVERYITMNDVIKSVNENRVSLVLPRLLPLSELINVLILPVDERDVWSWHGVCSVPSQQDHVSS